MKIRKFHFGAAFKTGLLTVALVCFLAAAPKTAGAQIPPVGGPCAACPPAPTCGIPCAMPGTTSQVSAPVITNFQKYLNKAAFTLQNHIANTIDDLTAAMLTSLNNVELDIIKWWDAMWYYDLRPSLQDMTAQLGGVGNADQSRAIASFNDSKDQAFMQQELQKDELADRQNFQSSEFICQAATNIAGGGGRAVVLARAVRQARERGRDAVALNKAGAVGDDGAGEIINAKWADYSRVFCNQNANGGSSGCATSGKFPDADVNVSRNLYNELTIDVKKDIDRQVALDALTENLVGPIVTNPMALSELKTAQGQEAYLMRRSYLARKDAAHVIPNIVSSWRMPGSRVGPWLAAMRGSVSATPLPAGTVSTNPSYREVMHGMVIDRFYNGTYGLGLIDEPASIKREKLLQSTLYLMQLRDYYELLERMALVLAVQTSTVLDQTYSSSLHEVNPVGP